MPAFTSPLRLLLVTLLASTTLVAAASEPQHFDVPMIRSSLWERDDVDPIENILAQTSHLISKYRHNFAAYEKNIGKKK